MCSCFRCSLWQWVWINPCFLKKILWVVWLKHMPDLLRDIKWQDVYIEYGMRSPLYHKRAIFSKKVWALTHQIFPASTKLQWVNDTFKTFDLRYSTMLQCPNKQLVDATRSFTACPLGSLPCSPLFPLARSSVPLSNRKERKTKSRPHFAGDIWVFFCLCLLYIPVTLRAANRPPFPRRRSTLPPFLIPTIIEHGRVRYTTSCLYHQNKTVNEPGDKIKK